MIILLTAKSNEYGRKLVQDGNNMYVLSGCCDARFDANHKFNEDTWVKCLGCGELLQKNDYGWSSDVEDLTLWEDYVPSGITSWGEFWFGIKKFGVKVTN